MFHINNGYFLLLIYLFFVSLKKDIAANIAVSSQNSQNETNQNLVYANDTPIKFETEEKISKKQKTKEISRSRFCDVKLLFVCLFVCST